MIGSPFRRAQPEVPVQVLRNRLTAFRCGHPLRPPGPLGRAGTVAPDMNFLDGADRAVVDVFPIEPQAVAGVALVAHLRDDAGLFGNLGHAPRLENRMGHGLFAINVLAHLHGHDRRRRVDVVGGADDHRINVLVLLLEHLAKVPVDLGLRMLLDGRSGPVQVHVAQGHDILTRDALDITAAATANANAGDVEPVVGRILPGGAEDAPRDEMERRHRGARTDELPPGQTWIPCLHSLHEYLPLFTYPTRTIDKLHIAAICYSLPSVVKSCQDVRVPWPRSRGHARFWAATCLRKRKHSAGCHPSPSLSSLRPRSGQALSEAKEPAFQCSSVFRDLLRPSFPAVPNRREARARPGR